jgi:hypothetical protein
MQNDTTMSVSIHRRSSMPAMHRHAIESILGFLGSFSELHNAIRVCKQWHRAVETMKVLSLSLELGPHCWLTVAHSRSPLLRHLGSLEEKIDDNGELPCLDTGMLRMLCQKARALHTLECYMVLDTDIYLPARLESLDVELIPLLSASFNRFLVCVSHLTQLTHLYVHVELDADMDFVQLNAPRLRSFALDASKHDDDSMFTDQQLDMFRTAYFAQLQKVQLPNLDHAQLEYLLRSPHALQWQAIHPIAGFPWNPEQGAALASLGNTLQELAMECGTVMEWMPFMKRLTSFTFHVGHKMQPDAIEHFCLLPCLTHLTLELSSLTDADMTRILSSMPHLARLQLRDMWMLHLTCFADTKTIHKSLCELHLSGAFHPEINRSNVIRNGLVHLRALTALRIVMRDPNSEFACLAPPTSLLPALRHFAYARF